MSKTHLNNAVAEREKESKGVVKSYVRVENHDLHQISIELLDNVAVVHNLTKLYEQLELPPAVCKALRRSNPDDYDFLKTMLAE